MEQRESVNCPKAMLVEVGSGYSSTTLIASVGFRVTIAHDPEVVLAFSLTPDQAEEIAAGLPAIAAHARANGL